MIAHYVASAFYETAVASDSSGAGNTAVIAGIFAIIGVAVGAVISLVSQAWFVHSQNRRDDYWRGVDVLADLLATARRIFLIQPSPTALSGANVTGIAPKETGLIEAFFGFDSASERLTLIIPDIESEVAEFRNKLLASVKPDTKDGRLEGEFNEQLNAFREKAKKQLQLQFPVFKWLRHFR
jgi:hypothetical protein